MSLFFLNIGRWVWSKLSIKAIAVFIVLALLGYGAHRGYQAILERGIAIGVAQQAKVTDQWKTKAEKAEAQSVKDKADRQAYVDKYNLYVAQTKQQQTDLATKQQGIVDALNRKIASINQQLTKAKELNRDIGKYISPSNDIACVMPTGMLLLYNRSLQDSAAARGFLAPSSSYAYAPSGVPCSTFAGIFVDNNAAAAQYRSLLIQWQSWYNDNQAALTAYFEANRAATPPPHP